MARQLTLLEAPPSWQLDDHTREVGRRGVAEARAALRKALAAGGPASTPDAGRQPRQSAA